MIARLPNQVIARRGEGMSKFEPPPAPPPAGPDAEAFEKPVSEAAATPAPRWSWSAALRLAAGLWLGGAALWYGWVAVCLCRLHRPLRRPGPAPAEGQAQAHEQAARLGLPRWPAAWCWPRCLPPVVW